MDLAKPILAKMKLLAVASGQMPAAAAMIKDFDLTKLPSLPHTHRDYTRREETRIKYQSQNEANNDKRNLITYEYWTDLYAIVKASTEKTAPVLSQEIEKACDLSLPANGGVQGGFFDGPRAWRMLKARLSDSQRSEHDTDFYRTAERLQRQSLLPNGCTAEEYDKKALAFILNIKPNLAQGYSEADATQYLIDLMPKELREGGRRIKAALHAEGKYLDHMHVVRQCRGLVREEQKTAAPQPAFMITDLDVRFPDLAMMMVTTGMELAFAGGPDAAYLGYGGAQPGGTTKWCDGCPHGKDGTLVCFTDPHYVGPPPIAVYQNVERWKGLMLAKAANAKKHNVPNSTVKVPSREDIARYNKARKEKRDRARPHADKKAALLLLPPPAAAGTPGAVAADTDSFEDWRQHLVDIQMCATEAGTEVAEIDDDDDDDDDDDGDDGTPQHWYVLEPLPGSGASPDLICLTDPEHLDVDGATHTVYEYSVDEAAAREHHGRLTTATGPEPEEPLTPSQMALALTEAAEKAVVHGSVGAATLAAAPGDPLGPTPLPACHGSAIGANASSYMYPEVKHASDAETLAKDRALADAPTPLPAPPPFAPSCRSADSDACAKACCSSAFSPGGTAGGYEPMFATPKAVAPAMAKTPAVAVKTPIVKRPDSATMAAPGTAPRAAVKRVVVRSPAVSAVDTSEARPRDHTVAIGLTVGLIVALVLLRLGGSSDFCAGTGLAAAAGHVYAIEQGCYESFTTGAVLRTMGAAVRLVVTHFHFAVMSIIVVLLLRGVAGGGGGLSGLSGFSHFDFVVIQDRAATAPVANARGSAAIMAAKRLHRRARRAVGTALTAAVAADCFADAE